MNNRIYHSKNTPLRDNPTWEEKWRGPDRGLIICWEVGKKLSMNNSELAEQAKNGELPVLGWKGGVEKVTKKKEKFGTLNYLAEWQGLRDEGLDIDMSQEVEHICSRTGIKVIFTGDVNKYRNA